MFFLVVRLIIMKTHATARDHVTIPAKSIYIHHARPLCPEPSAAAHAEHKKREGPTESMNPGVTSPSPLLYLDSVGDIKHTRCFLCVTHVLGWATSPRPKNPGGARQSRVPRVCIYNPFIILLTAAFLFIAERDGRVVAGDGDWIHRVRH